jgi:microcystin-dependent protein
MASVNFPLTFSLAPIPTGESLDANAYGQQLVSNLQAFISGNFLTGQIGGAQPTQNIGPWLNGSSWWFWDPVLQAYMPQTTVSSLPAGSILAYGGIAAPSGYLLCDGSSYLISAQTSLYAAIGTLYGTAGGGTFLVPDYRGRCILGAGSGAGLTPRVIASTLGEEMHVLSLGELAPHVHQDDHYHADDHAHGDDHFHDDDHTHSDIGHAHTYINAIKTSGSIVAGGSPLAYGTDTTGTGFANLNTKSASGYGVSTNYKSQAGFAATTAAKSASGYGANTGAKSSAGFGTTTSSNGGGAGHNTIPPALVSSFIIKS